MTTTATPTINSDTPTSPPTDASVIKDLSNAISDLDDATSQSIVHIPSDETPVGAIDDYEQPWGRLPGEPDFAWLLFTFFRDLGPKRSMEATYRFLETTKGRRGTGLPKQAPDRVNIVRNYRAKHDWAARVFAYDREQDRLYQLARSVEIRAMAERHSTILIDAINALTVPSQALILAMENNPDFIESLSKTNKNKLVSMANSTSRTLPSLMAAERLARDMPTEIVGGVVEHQIQHTIEPTQIGAILDILDSTGALDGRQPDSEFDEIVDAEVVEVYPVPSEDNDD